MGMVCSMVALGPADFSCSSDIRTQRSGVLSCIGSSYNPQSSMQPRPGGFQKLAGLRFIIKYRPGRENTDAEAYQEP